MTHSRSGPFGWEIADDVPELTKAVIAVEPAGPPFYNVVPTATSDPAAARQYGVAFDHLTYDPPVKNMADLAPKREDKPRGKDLQACWMASVPHKLTRLAGIPIMIVTAEASYHAAYDHCTSEYLKQVGSGQRFRSPGRERHSRQWPHDDAGKEQPRDRPADRGLDRQACQEVMTV